MLAAGKVIFKAFFDICRLSKGPQDIPASRNLLTLCLVVYGLCTLVLLVFSEPIDKAVISALIDVLLIMIFTQALLQIRNKASRWTQTVTALCGTGIIISVIALPVYFLIGFGDLNQLDSSSGQGMGLLLLAALACWNIVIMGHILRHALEVNFFSAILFSIAYVWIVFSVTTAVIPMEST